MTYIPPAPHLIKNPKSARAMRLHRKFALTNRTYYQKHVLGNDVKACENYRFCHLHDRHLHGEWNHHVDTYSAVFEASSRGHIKSTWTQMVNSQDMLSWPILKQLPFSNLEVSYAMDQAQEWNEKLRDITDFAIENLQLPFEDGVANKKETSYEFRYTDAKGIERTLESYSKGTGITGNIRMKHTKRVTIDDMINEDMNISIAAAEKKFLGSVIGSREPDTQIVYIGTVLEEGDPLDKIRTQEIGRGLFRGGEYPGVIEEDIPMLKEFYDKYLENKIAMMESGEYYDLENRYLEQFYSGHLKLEYANQNPIDLVRKMVAEQVMSRVDALIPRVLWPEKRPLSYHLDQIDIQGWIIYQTEFLLRFINDEEALFKKKWIDRAKELGKNIVLGREPEGPVTLGCDFAISTSISGDYNVFFLMEHVNNYKIPLDIIRFRGAEMNTDGKKGEVEDYIEWKLAETMDLYDPDATVAEEVGFQRMFGNTLRSSGYVVEAYNTGSEKHSSTRGIPSLDKPFRDNRFIIPQGDEPTRKKMSIFINELKGWQYVPAKKQFVSKAAHDDTTIGYWMSEIAYNDFLGSGFTFQGTMFGKNKSR